ncbi:D-alanyl-D-alanine carboxypeptidase [Streptomyces xanthochromogenes]|uniref:D-alanyl-D-alanine carboxypeptidase n=1 Tax=Streptomyces xanthochromogenes TaxID=67384 RepID=A0ABQ2ZL28_9ACTN|nr:D-alanyl-D-alanine carboxypeptidase [Streptomyces xanthochromogenes]
MNEKNSAKAGGPSGTEAARGDDSAAATAAGETPAERRNGAERDTAPRKDPAQADPGGSNSGSAEPVQDPSPSAERPDRTDPADSADSADRSDLGDKTLVFASPASRGNSPRRAEDAPPTAGEGHADSEGHEGAADGTGSAVDAAAGANSGSAAPASETPPRDGKPPKPGTPSPEAGSSEAGSPGRSTEVPPATGAPVAEASLPKSSAPEASTPEPKATAETAGPQPSGGEGSAPEEPQVPKAAEARVAAAKSDPRAASASVSPAPPTSSPVSDHRAVPTRDAASKPESEPKSETDPASESASASASAAAWARKPSWAARAESESESERTSEFVALKPDLPHPASPRRVAPTPAPPAVGDGPGQGSPEADVTREFGAPPRTDDRTMALTRPPASSPAPPSAAPAPTPATAAGGADAGGPPPPLDLLAQLTNTPPKPETVARTVGRRIKIWGTLVALLAVVLVVVQALRPLPTPTLKLTAESTHTAAGGALSLPWPSEGQAVVDINGLGRMGTYGEMKPLPIGSVAKVMTTYLVLRDHPLKAGDKGPSIPVDQKAQDDYTNGVKEKESVVEVKAGQQVSELEALQAVMLPSANNVARLLARWDASTEEAFIKKMNDTAKELGMTNTTYTDASGLMESTVSTAEDQVKLAKRAMADPVFRAIAKSPSYTSTTTSGGGTIDTARTQNNFNKLVPLNGVVGIKTGSTTKAGGNLLFAAETTVGDSKQLVIGAVFGQHRAPIIDTATAASKSLILAADKALRSETVVKKGDVVGHVDDGLGGTVPVVATKDLSVPVWSGASVGISLTDGGRTLPHTAKAGTQIGTLTVGTGIGEVKVPVALKGDLAEPSFGAKLTRIG